jgi:bile acid:Na+ symporter, BASS family
VKAAQFVLNKMMPFWLIVLSLLAYSAPNVFRHLAPFAIYCLGGVILIMSLTLNVSSVTQVFIRPKALIAGFIIKWITVPLAAVLAAHVVYANQPQLAAGTILDGSVPAGVSSNLFTFLSHGAVALAVSLTFIHTLLSPVLMVLLPLVLGIAIRYAFGAARIHAIRPILPMASAVLLYIVALGLVAAAAPAIAKNLDWVPVIGVTTTMLCIINLAVAYVVATALRFEEATARAIMFDVGVYNSGLGAVLASINFGPFAALPALMNSVLNMIVGSILASWLHGRPVAEAEGRVAMAAPGAAAARRT